MVDNTDETAAATEKKPRTFSTLDEVGLERRKLALACRSPLPVLDFILPGLLAKSIAVLVGPGGVSKSMLALQTASIIACGFDQWNLWTDGSQEITKGQVAVFNIEDPGEILDTRIHHISRSVPDHMREQFIDDLEANVDVWSLVGRNFAFGQKSKKSDVIVPTEWIDWVSDRVVGKRLAIIDTFIRGLNGLDENSSSEVAPILALIEVVARKTGCAFMILHHTNKQSGGKDGQAGAQQASRGSSAITDNARWQTNLSTMTEAEAEARDIDERKRWVQVDLSKVNYAPPMESRWLYRGEHGVLTGLIQPSEKSAASKNSNGYSATKRFSTPPNRPDAIDLAIPDDFGIHNHKGYRLDE